VEFKRMLVAIAAISSIILWILSLISSRRLSLSSVALTQALQSRTSRAAGGNSSH